MGLAASRRSHLLVGKGLGHDELLLSVLSGETATCLTSDIYRPAVSRGNAASEGTSVPSMLTSMNLPLAAGSRVLPPVRTRNIPWHRSWSVFTGPRSGAYEDAQPVARLRHLTW
jgi:hypothetical protein